METSPQKSEKLKVLLFIGEEDMKVRPEDYVPLFDEIEQQGIHDITMLTVTDAGAVESALLSPNTLCITIGYSFRNRKIADVFARAIDGGLRMLVLDSSLENKILAERLNITDIKHKVRIEKIDFGKRDEVDIEILGSILRDEISRIRSV